MCRRKDRGRYQQPIPFQILFAFRATFDGRLRISNGRRGTIRFDKRISTMIAVRPRHAASSPRRHAFEGSGQERDGFETPRLSAWQVFVQHVR